MQDVGTRSTALIVILVFGVLFSALYYTSSQVSGKNLTQNIHRNGGCLVLSTTKATAPFVLKTPSYLPMGYTFQCGQTDELQVFLVYSNKTLDAKTFEAGSSGEEIARGGTILVRTIDRKAVAGDRYVPTNDTKAVMDQVKSIKQYNPALKPVFLDINGAKAWGEEADPNGGMQILSFANGTTVVHTVPNPGSIWMYDHGTETILIGNVPLSELEKIAKSLQ